MDEATFIKSMRSASEVRDKGEVKKLKLELAKKEKRFADLDLLIKKVYEDNAMGKPPERRYEMLSSDYEKEQQELSEEVMADEEKKRKRRQYRREYQKAYREKHRPEIRRVIESAKEADRQKQITEAEMSTDVLLHTDSTEQVAAMVAGENNIFIEGSLPSKEEVKTKYGR